MSTPRLNSRVAELERRAPERAKHWVRVLQYDGQTREHAIAAWESENGPVGGRNVIMRVIINKPFASDGRTAGALCPA